MYNITFDEIMAYYRPHNQSIFDEIVKKCREKNLIPFVGAGLSFAYGYKLWDGVLEELMAYVRSTEKREEIAACIKAGNLFEAAQRIADNYPLFCNQLKKIVDYNKIGQCRKIPYKWHRAAAYVLPYLFGGGMVMTTNFDRVLETVFDDNGTAFDEFISPLEPHLLMQARQGNLHCLFKLHGDIGRDTISADRIVFTTKQYEKYYSADGPLVGELKNWFENKQLLFLGCSLDKDKTIDVLQTAFSKNSSLQHFAILACKEEDMDRRIVEMGELGINAIFYPDGKHDAVRVILERILEEVAPEKYAQLVDACKIYAENQKRPLMYDSNFIDFSGREEEMARLEDFCDSGETALWWAVTGPGGMGKSRLLFELRKKLEQQHWKVIWPESRRYAKLAEIETGAGNVLMVVDDAQEYLKDLGDWMAREVERPRGGKLRIILLERDGKDPYSASWAESIRDEMTYGRPLEGCLYEKEFLQLERLSDDALKAIMSNYAEKSGKPLKGEDHTQRLLDALGELDKGLLRPLYAIAIADTWCSGNDPAMMAKDSIMEELVKRELRFYSDRLKNMIGRTTATMRSELEKLLVQSIVEEPLFLDKINVADYPKLSAAAENADMDFAALIQNIGVVMKAKVIRHSVNKELPDEPEERQEKMVDVVRLNCPDLLKEYLVQQQIFHPREPNLKLLLSKDWQNRPHRLRFIARLLRDYPEKLKEQNEFWAAFFAAEPSGAYPANLYGWCVYGITEMIPGMAKEAVERLEALKDAYSENEEIALHYARGLSNLSLKQQLPEQENSIEKLSELREEYAENEEIACAYANGLIDISAKQHLAGCEDSVSKLRELYEAHSENERIAYYYAGGLANLSNEQQLPECEDSISKLRVLHEAYPEKERIALAYAGGLVPLSFKRTDEESVWRSVQEAKKLADRFESNANIYLFYAMTKFNLTLKQEGDALQRTVEELRRELQDHPEANEGFQKELDTYLEEHPEHSERYLPLRV